MNLDLVIKNTYIKLDRPKDRVAQVLKVQNKYLSESLNRVVYPEIAVLHLGTFIVDRRKFFSELLRNFVLLRKIKNKLLIIKEERGEKNKVYENNLRKYESISIEFRKLWEFKQTQQWNFQHSRRKIPNRSSVNYFRPKEDVEPVFETSN